MTIYDQFTKICKEKYMVVSSLMGADCKRYGMIIDKLENNYA